MLRLIVGHHVLIVQTEKKIVMTLINTIEKQISKVNTFLVAMALGLLLFAGKSEAQEVIKVKLNAVENKFSKSKENAKEVEMYVTIDTVQLESKKGVIFSVSLINNSGRDITLQNPLDFLQLMLVNEKGENVILPQPPKALINTRNPTRHRSFDVEEIKLNGREIKPDSLSSKITIKKGGSFEGLLSIKIMLGQNESNMRIRTGVKLLPGRYSFRVIFSLVGQDIESGILTAEVIPINYK